MPNPFKDCTCKQLQHNGSWMIRNLQVPVCPACKHLRNQLTKQAYQHRRRCFRQSLRQYLRLTFAVPSSWQMVENAVKHFNLMERI